MPHSGGGGSHGGGFHSGGGSSHSSSGGSSGPKISKTYYTGSHHYVYYNRGRYYNYYSTSRPANSKASYIFISAFIFIFVLFGLFAIFTMPFERPSKINNQSFSPKIIDANNIFNDKNEILNTLNEFNDKTGLVVYIETIDKNNREAEYYTLESCAYDKYVTTFKNNEKCLYIMYEYDYLQESYWAFETMYGDDTSGLFVGNREEEFTKSIDHNLRIYNLDEAFIKTFSDTSFMEKSISIEGLFFSVIWLLISLLLFIFSVLNGRKMLLMSNAKEIKDESELPYKCNYCGCEYYASTVEQCPHCGAGITHK